ncbi:MAG: outer membrane beta-barrel protein [Bacteroidales bacterium]|nr:outer membrane beta-barrel protein [Bacteroidales bacterium]
MSSKRDWTEDLPEFFEGYTEAAPEGLWEAVEAGSGAAAGRRRIAGWWYAGGALLAAAAVVAAVILFRPAADPSVIQFSSGEMVAESSASAPAPAPSPAPAAIPATIPAQIPATDTREAESVSGEPETAGQTPETPQSVSGEPKTAAQTPEAPQSVSEEPSPAPVPAQIHAADTREAGSVSGEPETAGQTPESPNPWMESNETAADQPKTTVVPLEREALKPFKPKQRHRIRVQAGVFGSGLMAQNVVQSGQAATHIASMLGSAPAIQTKSISGGATTFDPSIIGRNKPATTQNNHRQSARLGVGVKVNFLPHWGLESGLTFTTLNSTFETTRGNSTQSIERELHYMGIPLYLHFNALQWRGVSIYLAAGPMYEFTDETSESFSTRLNGKLISSATDNTLQKDHRWSFNLDAGLQLEFMENNAIYIQPGFSYHFPGRMVDGPGLQSYYTERPASFNLTIGYRLLL